MNLKRKQMGTGHMNEILHIFMLVYSVLNIYLSSRDSVTACHKILSHRHLELILKALRFVLYTTNRFASAWRLITTRHCKMVNIINCG